MSIREDYVCGGCLLTQFFDGTLCNGWIRQDIKRKGLSLEGDLLPDKILSIGLCGIETAPLFEWMGTREEDFDRFGIPRTRMPEVHAWADKYFEKEVGYPNLFLSLEAAQEYINRFVSLPNENQLLAFGLHKKYWAEIELLKEAHPSTVAPNGNRLSGFVDRGFYQSLRRHQPLPEGKVLGFDVIGYHFDIDHSWHCNNLAVDALQLFSFRPNEWGLIDDPIHADKLAAYANSEMIEEATWFPVLVVQIPL